MIKTEKLENGYIKTYSDEGYYIHGGNPEGDYEFAIDPEDAGRKYTETSKKINDVQVSVADYQALLKRVVELEAGQETQNQAIDDLVMQSIEEGA